jgi:hypothetical protein
MITIGAVNDSRFRFSAALAQPPGRCDQEVPGKQATTTASTAAVQEGFAWLSCVYFCHKSIALYED